MIKMAKNQLKSIPYLWLERRAAKSKIISFRAAHTYIAHIMEVNIFLSIYIIPQGRALEWRTPARRSQEGVHSYKFAPKDPITLRGETLNYVTVATDDF